jgi:5-methylcytosine-specific restriction endonuclease McrA
VQFDASSALKAKIELVKALSSHANPKGDLEKLFERALDLYAEHLQKKRFGKTDKPRGPTKRGLKRERAERFVLRRRPPSKRAAIETARSREHIPIATRREVIERDGLQCAYVSETGERCDERGFLQMHHQHAWARNGGDHPDNLSVLCSNHNRFMAEVDFGAEHVARRIEESRSRHQPASGVELRAVTEERIGEKF